MSITRIGQGRYRVRATDHNGRDRRIVVSGPRTLAEELEARIVQNRLRAKHGLEVDKARITLDDHWHDWIARFERGLVGKRVPTLKTLEILRNRYAHLASLHPLWLDQISRERLEQALESCPSTYAAHRACVTMRRLLLDARDRGFAIDSSALTVRVAQPKTRREGRALTWDEVEEIAAWMPSWVERSVPFLALTGLRVSEMCALTDADVFDDYILIRASKTETGRRKVYLCQRAKMLVREQMLVRPPTSTLLFPTSSGAPYTKDSFRRVLQRAAERAGIGHVTPHDLRRTAMTLLARAGVDAMLAKEQLGWSDATFAHMLPIYRRVASWELPRAVGRLDDLLAEDGGKKPASLVC